MVVRNTLTTEEIRPQARRIELKAATRGGYRNVKNPHRRRSPVAVGRPTAILWPSFKGERSMFIRQQLAFPTVGTMT